MVYAAMTFWLLIIVFTAYGVFQLWAGLVRPKIINVILLPGTMIAQLGLVIGLLITGGTINDTTLIKDDDTAEPSAGETTKTRIPVLGPIIIALLPILACGFSVYAVITTMGQEVMGTWGDSASAIALPATFDSFWEFLRSAVTLVEHVTAAVLNSDFNMWQTWLFLYLVVCLTVRMAPLPGTHRGAIGAIMVVGVAVTLFSLATHTTVEGLTGMWGILSFSAGSLLFLLIVSLMVRGGVGLFKILTNQLVH